MSLEYVEYKRSLPQCVKIPMNFNQDIPNFDDRQVFWGVVDFGGFLHICNKEHEVTIDTPEKFFDIFTRKRFTFLVTSVNWISLLFKSFPDKVKDGLCFDSHMGVEYGSYTIYRAHAHAQKISIRKGNTWYGIIVYPFRSAEIAPHKDPEPIITQYVDELPKATGIQPCTASVSAAYRNFMFDYQENDRVGEQFKIVRNMQKTDPLSLEMYYNACKRPIMSTASIGHVESSFEEDMEHAYLTAIHNAQSMSAWNVYIETSPTYDPDAIFGAYYVQVTMPTWFRFTPNNFRAADVTGDYWGTYACTGGPQLLHIGQLKARLWTDLGIPFKVLKAHKIFPAGASEYPWRKRTDAIKTLLQPEYKKQFPYVNFSQIYQKAIGGLLHVHEIYKGEPVLETMSCFNPVLANHIYEFVDVANWTRLNQHPTHAQVAYSIDANTVLDYAGRRPDPQGMFREKSARKSEDKVQPTERFFANPREKDKDIELLSPRYDAIKEAARKGLDKAVLVKPITVTWPLIYNGYAIPKDEGKAINTPIILNTGGENRMTAKGEVSVLPKDLVENCIELRDPKVEDISRIEAQRLPVGDFDYEYR